MYLVLHLVNLFQLSPYNIKSVFNTEQCILPVEITMGGVKIVVFVN